MQVCLEKTMVAFKGAVPASFMSPGGEALTRPAEAAPQSLGGRYHHKLAPSFIPVLAPPEDLKYFHSKASQCFCNADLSGQLQGWPGEAIRAGRVSTVLTVWVNPSSDTDHLGDLGQAT